MFSRHIIGDSRSIIDNARVTLQLVASFTITNYDHRIFIVQATSERDNKLVPYSQHYIFFVTYESAQ